MKLRFILRDGSRILQQAKKCPVLYIERWEDVPLVGEEFTLTNGDTFVHEKGAWKNSGVAIAMLEQENQRALDRDTELRPITTCSNSSTEKSYGDFATIDPGFAHPPTGGLAMEHLHRQAEGHEENNCSLGARGVRYHAVGDEEKTRRSASAVTFTRCSDKSCPKAHVFNKF